MEKILVLDFGGQYNQLIARRVRDLNVYAEIKPYNGITPEEIAAEMKTFLERIPPQISYHIAREGIFLTGGSTKIPYIDNYLASYTGFSFKLSDLYEKATVTGLEKIIRDRDMMKWAQPVKQRKL